MATIDHLPWRYDHWHEHPEELQVRDDHTLVCIHEDNDRVTFTENMIRDRDIPEMCRRTARLQRHNKWSFQLLLTNEVDRGGQNLSVPYSSNAVQALQSHWNIPHNYIPRSNSTETVTIHFSPKLGDNAWKGLTLDLDLIMSVVIYDSTNHRTFGICVLQRPQDGESVVRRLERTPGFAMNPFFVPLIMATFRVQHLRAGLDRTYQDCIQKEQNLGFWSEDSEKSVDQVLDFERMPQSLNKLATQNANAELICSFTMSALNCLRDQLQAWPEGLSPAVTVEIQEQVCYLQRSTATCLTMSKRTKDNIQSMTQTVYATLQQRDNELNHRYGADMRLITAITLLFLPGTFVATFFSTTFWDFSPENKGAKVSYWVYLYFVVTVGLTLLVLVVWRKFNTLKRWTMEALQTLHRVPMPKRLKRKKTIDDEAGE